MPSMKSKLRLMCAFAALAALALAVSCRGFFPPEQLSSITLSPTSPNVPLGGTTQMTAFGTNTDGSSAGNITAKVTWSTSNGTISVTSGGLLSGNDLSSSAVTIMAQDQGITATASANVCLEGGSGFTLTFMPTTATQGQSELVTATANVGSMTGVDISSGVTWSTNNTNVVVTAGDPASIDTTNLGTITSNVIVTIFATYSCNGVNNNFNAQLTVQP